MASMLLSRPRSRKLLAFAFLGLAFGGVGAVTVAGCGPSAPAAAPKPCDIQIVTLNLYAADNINPNEKGNPRPVVIRLYQLKNDVRMENATYDEILLKDKEVLQDDLLKMDELSIFPNDLVQVKFERIKEASVLAGVALFHSPKGTSWKTYYAFPPLPSDAAACGARGGDAGADGGKGESDPQTAFFVESTKIDNGSQFDESMFPNATSIRKVDLPKRSASPEAPSGPPGSPAATPTPR
jgi:type VI secretion system protein VasD